MLVETLSSIVNQNTPSTELEIIVVTQNDALQQATLDVLADSNHHVIYRPVDETISALRNQGAAIAKGELFAFLDADVELSPNWLNAMISQLEDTPTRALVSAVQKCSDDAPPLEKIRTALSNAAVDTNVRFLPGRNLLVRRTTFEEIGGFPEHLVTCEDYYFTDMVHKKGHLYYSSAADYVHLGEDKKYSEMYKKEIWRGQSNLQSIKGRAIPLSELPSFLVPLWILVFFVATLLSLLSGEGLLVLISFVLLLLPVSLYSLRLFKICKGKVGLLDIFHFYGLYFPARIIGTLSGLFKVIKV